MSVKIVEIGTSITWGFFEHLNWPNITLPSVCSLVGCTGVLPVVYTRCMCSVLISAIIRYVILMASYC